VLRKRELELRLLREPQLQLTLGVLRGSALARTRRFGLGLPLRQLLLDDGTNGSECQPLNLGLEPREFIVQRGRTSRTPHECKSIVEGSGQSKSRRLGGWPTACWDET
jgi:hypothetical protein